MRGRLIRIVAAVAVGSVVAGSAASLGGLGSANLGAGDAQVAACDGDGVTTSYTTQGGKVTSVMVGGIADPGCEGADVSVTLTQSATSVGAGGPQPVAADGDTADDAATVSVTPQPGAEQVDGVSVSIVGP